MSKRKHISRPEMHSDDQPRSCLTCGETFQSHGIGNRMCKRCARILEPVHYPQDRSRENRWAPGFEARDAACREAIGMKPRPRRWADTWI